MTLNEGLEQSGLTILIFFYFLTRHLRFANYWNSLLNFVMSASSLDSFRTRLLNYLCTWFYFVISK